MKKFIYISGIVAVFFMIFGAAFKVLHFPGANILLCLSIFFFCFWFLPAALISNYKSQEVKRYKWLSIVTYIVFTVVMISACFKVLHWPGAGILLLVSVPLPFVLFLPVYLYHIKKDKNYSLTNLLGVMFGLTFIAIFSAMLALNISKSVLISISDDVIWQETNMDYNLSKIVGVTGNEDLIKKSDAVCSYIDELKCELYTGTGSFDACKDGKPVAGFSIEKVFALDNTDVANMMIFSETNLRRIDALKEKIQDLKNSIASSPGATDEIKKLSNDLLLPVDENAAPDFKTTWERYEFPTTHLIAVVDALTRIQNNVRFIEAEILSK